MGPRDGTSKIMDRIMAMPSVDADNAGKHGFAIAYGGGSGTGKTTCMLSWPDPMRGIYADVNKKVLENEIKRGRDINLTVPQTWSDYEDVFVPAVENRLFDCKTIVVDTIDFLSNLLWDDLRESVDNSGKGRGILTIPNYGVGANKLLQTTARMVRATQYIEGKRNYNVIFTYHLQDVTNEAGALLKVTPALMGRSKDILPSIFDYCFMTDVEQVGTTVKVDGRSKVEYKKSFFIHTAPPTKYHKDICKSGSELPVKCSGMYEDLMGYMKKEAASGA